MIQTANFYNRIRNQQISQTDRFCVCSSLFWTKLELRAKKQFKAQYSVYVWLLYTLQVFKDTSIQTPLHMAELLLQIIKKKKLMDHFQGFGEFQCTSVWTAIR